MSKKNRRKNMRKSRALLRGYVPDVEIEERGS
jgi:hypothetical protein